MTPIVRAGLMFVTLVGLAVFFTFTKANPFSNQFELQAQFESAKNLKTGTSEVRIAGVEVGRIKKIEELSPDSPGALVTMEIEKAGLPIHEDAELKVRPLIFLEGNYFVDLRPGSPSAPPVKDGYTVPITQTAIPVQFGDLLTALQSDTRKDLRTFFAEYAFKGLNGGGAEGFNGSIEFWEPAYRSSSLANDAMLGTRPGDLRRVVGGQQKTLAALSDNEGALKDLITNLNVTASSLAREDDSLQAAVPALRDVVTAGPPAFRSLNASLPSLSRFAKDALPGTRSSGPTLDALSPFVRQLRALVQPSELRGLVDDLEPTVPALARLNRRTVPVLSENRALAACTNNVTIPFQETPIPNPDGAPGTASPGVGENGDTDKDPDNNGVDSNDDQLVMRQIPRSLVGLAGESRETDANSPAFRVNFSGGNQGAFFNGSTEGETFAALPQGVSGARPALPETGRTGDVWEYRPDVPCETQEPPNLEAPLGAPSGDPASAASSENPASLNFEGRQPAPTPEQLLALKETLAKSSGGDPRKKRQLDQRFAQALARSGFEEKNGKLVKKQNPAPPKPSDRRTRP